MENSVTNLLIRALRIYNENSKNFNKLLEILDILTEKISNNFRFLLNDYNRSELKKVSEFIRTNKLPERYENYPKKPLAFLDVGWGNAVDENCEVKDPLKILVIWYDPKIYKISFGILESQNKDQMINDCLEKIGIKNG